jgi:hypothetical protein
MSSRFSTVSCGGACNEYVEYFNRSDIDPTLWHFTDEDDVKAIAGFSVVPKNDGVTQRKLLMAVPANYWWSSADDRAHLGMAGGPALASIYAPGGASFACWDQSNASTAVKTPRWMWRWVTAPLLRARDVWARLNAQL